VLVVIYVLVGGWFGSFKAPLVIMAPIPLTLVGILPAHALLGAFFTATSMIGSSVFTAFVGLDLFQSGLTNWCPMMTFLRLLGVPASAGQTRPRCDC
jgi:DUF2892 family protein